MAAEVLASWVDSGTPEEIASRPPCSGCGEDCRCLLNRTSAAMRWLLEFSNVRLPPLDGWELREDRIYALDHAPAEAHVVVTVHWEGEAPMEDVADINHGPVRVAVYGLPDVVGERP